MNATIDASISSPRQFLGFDENGQVYEAENRILRRIRAGFKEQARDLHRMYVEHGLAGMGFVDTVLRADGDLEHRKLTVSYPYEWPASMHKDAVLFHLKLVEDLDHLGLTLKDALPNNILFEHTRPVFVDFLSLVPTAKLRDNEWLAAGGYADARFAVVERMLLPYMILPLLFMARRDYRTARELLSTRSCNSEGKPPAWGELLRPPPRGHWRTFVRTLRASAAFFPHRNGGRRRSAGQFRALISQLARDVALLDVAPPRSAYSSYYDEKKEAQSRADPARFLPKQKAVYDVLRAKAPRSVLDLGANTGWFSELAAGLGASVIALEEDESCIDILYGRAKREGLRILPLRGSFGDLATEIHGARALAKDFADRGIGKNALYRPGLERIGADLVLVLGLLHHLVLGEGRALESVFEALARLSHKTLVVEFVALEDDKIQEDPSFFPSLGQFGPANYNLDLAVQVGRRHFARVDVLASNPATRTLLVLDR